MPMYIHVLHAYTYIHTYIHTYIKHMHFCMYMYMNASYIGAKSQMGSACASFAALRAPLPQPAVRIHGPCNFENEIPPFTQAGCIGCVSVVPSLFSFYARTQPPTLWLQPDGPSHVPRHCHGERSCSYHRPSITTQASHSKCAKKTSPVRCESESD